MDTNFSDLVKKLEKNAVSALKRQNWRMYEYGENKLLMFVNFLLIS